MIHIRIDGVAYGMNNRSKKLKDRKLLKEFFDLPAGNFNMLSVLIKLEKLGFSFDNNFSLFRFNDIPVIWNPIHQGDNGQDILNYVFDNCVFAVEAYKSKHVEK